MSCTTVLVGKKASNDNSTMIARTDDRHFNVKRMTVVTPEEQPRVYESVLTHQQVSLPDNPLRYTSCPSVDPGCGIWAATGINEANVGMTATETSSSNPRVLAADPLLPGPGSGTPGGIGEEDMVVLVLPYIRSAREGVLRLGRLLENCGTYESNGIAFNDENEVWWLETIGGHHWMARKIPDDAVVFNPNRFCMDSFDLEDALGPGREHLCSRDLRTFIEEHMLDLNREGTWDPRRAFGSCRDYDRLYNAPRSWYAGRFFAPHRYRWEGEDAQFTPESDDIPWLYMPERRITPEDVRYLLASHYQGTPYDPYRRQDDGKRGIYLPIGVNHTGVTAICQIRSGVPEANKGLEWICFGSTTYAAMFPLYANVGRIPEYLRDTGPGASTDSLYWCSRLIAALADPHYALCVKEIDLYQEYAMTLGRRIIADYDKRMADGGSELLRLEANETIAEAIRTETARVLDSVLRTASEQMKNGYDRSAY